MCVEVEQSLTALFAFHNFVNLMTAGENKKKISMLSDQTELFDIGCFVSFYTALKTENDHLESLTEVWFFF